jgi:hypothetical protein
MAIIISKIKEFSESRLLTVLTTISLIFTFLIYLLMRPIELDLTTQTAYGVIDLEFAWNIEQMETILSSWGEELIAKEINAVLLDFGFLIVYSLSLFGVTLLLTKAGTFTNLTHLGYYFAILPFIAAGFDFIENVNLLLILTSPSSFPSFAPLFASICAALKFALIAITILFWFVGIIYSLLRRIL